MSKFKSLCQGRISLWLKNKKSGFTIIEALVVLFIFALITTTFYSVFTVGTKYIIESKNRLGALAVANEKMEIIRNLKYENIGVMGGEIEGNIPHEEDVIENTRSYHVHTLVEYVQDSFDGVFPADTAPEDYKKVTITVSWNNGGISKGEVELISRFVPSGLEVANAGDGILSINIFSDQPGGTGISETNVHIYNPDTGLNTDKETDASGSVTFMGSNVKNSIQKYEITITKSGYETVNTMPSYPTTSYNPTDVHASVVIGTINVANIVQNKLANLKISTSDYLGQPLPNVNFSIVGGRRMGTDFAYPYDPIYNFNTSTNTGTTGEKDFETVSPGQYLITLPESVTNTYEVIGEYPISSFSLFSDQNLDFEIKLANKSQTSLMLKVISDETSNPPVSGAEVKLTNALGYNVTQNTGNDGIIFFPVTADVFQSGTYNLEITADGFEKSDSQVTVNSGELKIESITLVGS